MTLQSPLSAETKRIADCLSQVGSLCNYLTAGMKEFERNYQ